MHSSKLPVPTFAFGIAILFLSLISVPTTWADGWVNATIQSSSTPIYKQPNNSSEKLGEYKAGTTVKVFSAPRNGFYSIHFSRPFKGTNYVWVPADAVRLQGGDVANDRRSNRNLASNEGALSGSSKHQVFVEGGGFLISLGDVQRTLGDPSSTFLSWGIGAGYQYRWSPKIATSIRSYYYSISNPVVNMNDATIRYSAYGIVTTLNVSYLILSQRTFSLLGEVGAGLSSNMAGNSTIDPSNNLNALVTYNPVLGFPVVFSVIGSLRLSKTLNMMVRAGYQLHTINSVPLYPLPSASSTSLISNFNLSAPFATLGMSYGF